MAGMGNEIFIGEGFRLQPTSDASIASMQMDSTDISDINYTGNPEGNVSANPGSLCRDPVAGNIYYKASASDTSGWALLNTGGGGGGITTINGDSGSITGSTATVFANTADNNSGSSVSFSNSGTTSTLNLTDSNTNTLLGYLAGNSSISGASNTGLGFHALNNCTSGNSNTGCGYNSLYSVTTGFQNTALGRASGFSIVTGNSNVSIGINANASGDTSNNVAVGNSALYLNAGAGNVAVGSLAGQYNLGSYNSFIGYSCAFNGSGSGSYNVGMGYYTFAGLINGSYNTSIGHNSTPTVTTGSYNTCLGYVAGNNLVTSDSSNILIGNVGTSGVSNAIVIGTQGSGSAQQNACQIAGITGSSITGGLPVFVDSSGNLGTDNTASGIISLGNIPIDFTQTGSTLLFTTGAKTFFPTNIALYANSITGGPGFPTYSIGWTAPDYLELGPNSSGYNPYQQSTVLYASPNPSQTQQTLAIPPNTSVYINVSLASSGSVDTETVSLVGFYLP